jgi:SAM-dependent methyltransferase
MDKVETEIKQSVREFYDRVGWQEVDAGLYQNARYEDLRPVSREYTHNCHLRVARHLSPAGEYLLDAGSGPIQYPEYLAYSQGYRARVCADISIVALQEARRRIGDRQSGGHGLFVVADVANLPFAEDAFDAAVALHTIHHLPQSEHPQAYAELHRILAPGRTAVVVDGWNNPPLMRVFANPLRWRKRLRNAARGLLGKPAASRPGRDGDKPGPRSQTVPNGTLPKGTGPKGTFIRKNSAARLKQTVGRSIPLEIRVWRSVSVRFMRAFIHPRLGGRGLLRLLYRLEERFPRFFGENGQYPLIIVVKSNS